MGFKISLPMNIPLENVHRYAEIDIDQALTRTLGRRYAEYRKKWNTAGIENIPLFPIHIDFEVIDRCNQSCRMCPRNDKFHPNVNFNLNTGKLLDVSVYRDIIDDGVKKGLFSINLGAFAEPLLHRDVFQMVAYAHRQGVIDSRLITNGLLLDRYLDQIFDSGLVNLFVSIDAFTEKTYRKIRGSKFSKVKKNLLKFLEEKKRRQQLLPITRVSFVEMSENRNEKDAFIQFWQERVDFIDIQIYDNFNVNPTIAIDGSQPKKWTCTAPWKRLSVLAGGDILPCCNFFGRNIPIGNIRQNTIQEAWNAEKITRIREGIINDNIPNCSVCQRIGE